MNRSKLVSWILAAAAAVIALTGSVGVRAEVQGQVRVSIKLGSARVTLHEPVYVEFSVHNGLSEPVGFDLGMNAISNLNSRSLVPQGRCTVSVR